MTYSVMIVDDDKRIREGLLRHIDWKSLDFDLPILGSSGQEALEILKYRKIDVLITDIRMPAMSGLDLSAKVSSSYSDTVIIILSGYNDFEYAKTAMKYGIKHYLTKPTDLEQFTKVITEIKNEMEAKRKQLYYIKDMEKRYNEVVKQLLEQFLVDLTNGAIRSETAAQNFMSQHDIHFPYPYYNIVSVEIADLENTAVNKWKYDSNQFTLSLVNMLKIILNDYNLVYYTYSITNNIINIILNFDNTVDISELCSKLFIYSGSIGKTESVIAVSESVRSIWHISTCSSQVQEILSFNQFNKVNGVINYSEIKSKAVIETSYPVEKEKLLLSYITNNDISKALNIIDNILEPVHSYNSHINKCREYFIKLLFAIESYLSDFNINMKEIDLETLSPLKKSMEFSNINDIAIWLKDFVIKVCHHMENTKQPYSYRFIEMAKEYIEKNYMNDITLYSASEYIHLSPAYISKIFKKATGYNFVEYLSMIRVNRAKSLLSDINTKVYEVGGLVGYKSTKHFSQVFKSYTGMTPTEYRESINVVKDVK